MKIRKYTVALMVLLLLSITTFAFARISVQFDDMGAFTGPAGAYSRYANLAALVASHPIPPGLSVTIVVNQQMDVGAAALTIPGNITLDFKRQGAINATVGQTVTFAWGVTQIVARNNQTIFVGLGTFVIPNGGIRHFGWWGPVGDGITVDTIKFQAALTASENGTLRASKPTTSYIIGEVFFADNTNLIIEPGTIFQAIPKASLGPTEQLFNIIDVSNVYISGYGAILQGTGDYVFAVDGEQHHGVNILGSTNVVVEGLASNDTGGDGFIVSGGLTQAWSENIILRDIPADANFRQGLTISSVKGLRVINGRFTNTSGTAPAAGIDIEPDDNTHFLEDIILENPYTAGNDGNGIVIAFTNIVGATDKIVDITIINHRDYQSNYSMYIGPLDLGGNIVDGSIKIIDSLSIEPDHAAITIWGYDSDGPRISVMRPVSYRPNETGLGANRYDSSFIVLRQVAEGGPTSLGNVRFIEAISIDNRGVPRKPNAFYFADEDTQSVINVDIMDPIELSGATANSEILHAGSGVIRDPREILRYDAPANFNLELSNYARLVTNTGAGGLVIVSVLANFYAGGPDITFEVTVAQQLRIDPDGGSTIHPYGTGAGTYAQSNVIGCRMTIRRTSATGWKVMSLTESCWTWE